MTETTSRIPTPNQWLNATLRSIEMSNAALARAIGQDRALVQRWVNGREQIPKHQLAEIAAQLGTPADLDYAIRLKNCEDFGDSLRRRLRELARITRCDAEVLESEAFGLLERKTTEENTANSGEYASLMFYNMTHAAFIFRLWHQATIARDFRGILTAETMKLHVRYPANHFLGLALSLGHAGGLMTELREQCLDQLRDIATTRSRSSPHELTRRDHAIHLLARHGRQADQMFVNEVVEDAVVSDEPFSIRLGYAGLMLQPGAAELVEKYIWQLSNNALLAEADLTFDAVHYGDAELGQDQQMPTNVACFSRVTANILRRLETPRQYGAIAGLDARRLLGVLEVSNPQALLTDGQGGQTQKRLEGILATGLGDHSANVVADLKTVSDRLNSLQR